MNPRLMLLTCFGIGRIPVAPGTFGSLPPIAIAFGLACAGVEGWQINLAIGLLGLAFAIVCVRFGSEGERQFGGKDSQRIVADEVAGQCVALLLLPWRGPEDWAFNAALAGGSFATFRVFDILKPPPIRRLQDLAGGRGIVLDDLLAGVYALIVVQIAARVLMA